MLELPLYFGAEPPILLFETLEGVERDLVGVTPGIAGENVVVRPMPGGPVDVLRRGSTRGESVIVHARFYGRRGRGAKVFVPNAVIRALALSKTRGSEAHAADRLRRIGRNACARGILMTRVVTRRRMIRFMPRRRDDGIREIRSQLAAAIVRSLGPMSQHVVAPRFGIRQPRMSELNRGVVDRCSIEWLIGRIYRLGGTVQVTVTLGDAGRKWVLDRAAVLRAGAPEVGGDS